MPRLINEPIAKSCATTLLSVSFQGMVLRQSRMDHRHLHLILPMAQNEHRL